MMTLSWLITALVVLILVTFAIALVGINRLPLGERPKTAVFDRFGREEGVAANPDYHENPGEPHDQQMPAPEQPRSTGEQSRRG